MMKGIQSDTIIGDTSIVQAKWSFKDIYVPKKDEDFGNITFEYEFKTYNGTTYYRFYNYEHSTGTTRFESAGKLHKKYSSAMKEVFKKKEHSLLVKTLSDNVDTWAPMVVIQTRRCLN